MTSNNHREQIGKEKLKTDNNNWKALADFYFHQWRDTAHGKGTGRKKEAVFFFF